MINIATLLFDISPLVKLSVKGESMFPTIKQNDTVFANKLVYLVRNPRVGEVVVLKDPRASSKKRYIIKRIQDIKNEAYFVVGDNKDKSTDSRQFGFVKKKDIIGKVFTL